MRLGSDQLWTCVGAGVFDPPKDAGSEYGPPRRGHAKLADDLAKCRNILVLRLLTRKAREERRCSTSVMAALIAVAGVVLECRQTEVDGNGADPAVEQRW